MKDGLTDCRIEGFKDLRVSEEQFVSLPSNPLTLNASALSFNPFDLLLHGFQDLKASGLKVFGPTFIPGETQKLCRDLGVPY